MEETEIQGKLSARATAADSSIDIANRNGMPAQLSRNDAVCDSGCDNRRARVPDRTLGILRKYPGMKRR